LNYLRATYYITVTASKAPVTVKVAPSLKAFSVSHNRCTAALLHCCQMMLRSKVRVAASHLDGFVPHQLLHCPDVYASHDKTTRKGMSQAMPSESRSIRFLYDSLKPLARFRQF
jgi:hypothetical protein